MKKEKNTQHNTQLWPVMFRRVVSHSGSGFSRCTPIITGRKNTTSCLLYLLLLFACQGFWKQTRNFLLYLCCRIFSLLFSSLSLRCCWCCVLFRVREYSRPVWTVWCDRSALHFNTLDGEQTSHLTKTSETVAFPMKKKRWRKSVNVNMDKHRWYGKDAIFYSKCYFFIKKTASIAKAIFNRGPFSFQNPLYILRFDCDMM